MNYTNIKQLIESSTGKNVLHENPLSPTTRFYQFHGNYAGPGNRGGMPVDKLDRAAFHHDVAYHRSRSLPDKKEALAKRLKADHHFVGRLQKIVADKSHPRNVRIKAVVAHAFFVSKLRFAPKK
jgi:hypothetical protein